MVSLQWFDVSYVILALDRFLKREDMILLCNNFEGSNEKTGWQQKDEVLE